MTSKERITAAWNGKSADHIPLTFQCFGNPVPRALRWKSRGKEVRHWYTLRLEHIHTLPELWDLEDDFRRVLAWQSLGVDDLLDVSMPWSAHPEVRWQDRRIPPQGEEPYPILLREYQTPDGVLRHAVRQTGEEQGEGWVVQPDFVPLFEDFNIPRAVEHAVSSPDDVAKIRYLYCPPDAEAKAWFTGRMKAVKEFAESNGIAVQAWSAFGMDGVVWLTGTQGAILMAMDHPEAFGRLLEIITEADLTRTELAASTAGVDMVVERGWYSSTNFWSPALLDRFLLPHIQTLARAAHRHGKKFCYTVTTGLEVLGHRLADAGVDVLYWVDPLLDGASLEKIHDLLGKRLCLVGGANSITLSSKDPSRNEAEVKRAIQVLGPTGRFILHPTDAIFPDTPWEGVEVMIEAWKKYR